MSWGDECPDLDDVRRDARNHARYDVEDDAGASTYRARRYGDCEDAREEYRRIYRREYGLAEEEAAEERAAARRREQAEADIWPEEWP